MKKLTALFIAVVIILSCMPVSAAKEISLDFLMTDYTPESVEYEASSTYEVKLSKPMEMLDAVSEAMSNNLPVNPIDLRMMIEGLFDLKGKTTVKQRITESGNKMEAVISDESNLPFIMNDRLSADITASADIWMDMNVKEKKLEYIIDSPLSAGKYLLINEQLFALNEAEGVDMFGLMSELIFSEKLEEYEKLIIDSVRSNAVVSGNKSEVKLVFTDIGLKKFVADVLIDYIRLFGESLGIPADGFNEEELAGVMTALAAIKIFDDEALVINCSVDGKGRMTACDLKLNVDINLFDIISAFGGDTEGLTKENSNISFTVSAKNTVKYKKVNIEKPVLAEENTVNLYDMINTTEPVYEGDSEPEEYFYPWVYVEFEGKNSVYGNDGVVPLRSLLEAFGYTVEYNNGVIKATNTSRYAEYEWFEVYMNSTAVITSDSKFFMNAPVTNIGGVAYIKLSDAELIMNSVVDYIGYYPEDNIYNVSFMRNKTEEDF